MIWSNKQFEQVQYAKTSVTLTWDLILVLFSMGSKLISLKKTWLKPCYGFQEFQRCLIMVYMLEIIANVRTRLEN